MPREGYLTASSIAAAAGLNPYESRQECARLLLGLKEKEPFAAGEWGNDQEDMTLRYYEALSGNLVEQEQHWMESGFIGCHVDGIVWNQGVPIVVEAKSPVSIESYEKNYQEPPAYYLPQVQVQMYLAQAPAAHFVARFGDQARVWSITRHGEYIGKLFDELWWFWAHIERMEIPPRRKKPLMPAVEVVKLWEI